MCAWVNTTATGRLPASSSVLWTASGSNPGSTTIASSPPSADSSQQLVPYGLRSKTSRYMRRSCYRRGTWRPLRGAGVEQHRERTVVEQVHRHLRAEHTAADADVCRLELRGEVLDQLGRTAGLGRAEERRSPALARVGEQREGRH